MFVSRADELVAAVAAIGGEEDERELARELAVQCGWGERDVRMPLLPSGVSHGVPWGVGLAIEAGARCERRVFVEAQTDPPSPDSYWQRASSVTRWAASRGADTSRLEAITEGLGPPFRVWHAVAFAPLRWHAYVCIPYGHHDAAVAALQRAGGGALPPLRARDRVTMVSLDLTPALRAKAYVLMPDASLEELAALHDRAGHAVPGEAQRFGERMLAATHRRIWWLAALGFVDASRPATCALHFGVERHASEGDVRSRVRTSLEEHGLDAGPWRRASAGVASHHFVTFQRRAGRPRVTTWFMPAAVQ
jgi:hypothetical protein